jgi:hypothetical protein
MTRQKKQTDLVPQGEIVLVNKPEPPKEIAPSTLNKMKPKKELTEKQKENLAKLIEKNKQRALERRNVITNNVPENIPEDKIAVIVKPKRAYNKKNKDYWPNEQKEFETPSIELPLSNPELTRQNGYRQELPSTPMSHRVPPKKAHKKKETYYETSETSQTEYSSEEEDSSSDDERVNKYVLKAHKKMETLKQIEQKMAQLKNPYSARGMSIF